MFGNQNCSPNRGLFGGSAQQGQSLFSSPSKGQDYHPSGGGLFGGGMPFYGVCAQHRNKPIELFCKTDKVKICVNCAYSEAHKGHDIDLIENMRPSMFDKGNLYEKSLKKVQNSRKSINSIIDEKAKPFDQILKERQRNEEITRLKAWFLIQHYIDSQKVNFGKTLETKSLSENELRETAEDYRKGSDSGLVKTATETLEEIHAKFDESVFESLSAENKEAIQEQSENLKNELNEIYNQESGDVLKLKSHFLVKKGQNYIELETRTEAESFELNLSDLKDVTSVSIIYEKTWFHEEELNLLKLVLLNLPSLEKLSLQCSDIAASQASSLINGCSIFAHLLLSFQLAINLPLDKLKSFVFVSDAKSTVEHNQISQLILNLTSTMNSLKSIKIHLNHLFEDSVLKEWNELEALKLVRDSEEPKKLKELRESVEQDELKSITALIKEKGLEVLKKSKIGRSIKILDILEKNKNLENAEFIMPNVEIEDFELRSLRQYQANASIKKLLIKAKTYDSSIPEEAKETVRSGGLFGGSATGAVGTGTTGGGLFGNSKVAVETTTGTTTGTTGTAGTAGAGTIGGMLGMKSAAQPGHWGGTTGGAVGATIANKPTAQPGHLGGTTGGVGGLFGVNRPTGQPLSLGGTTAGAIGVSFGSIPNAQPGHSGGNNKGEKKMHHGQ